ncbi:hypothetical protein L1049_016107 [Liquidambar formosana]|uniref:Uncharacterized protein n=1 Tax=Liquidambar formosana TaxID=63359 RepID=A0AAP0S027_LIQFO
MEESMNQIEAIPSSPQIGGPPSDEGTGGDEGKEPLQITNRGSPKSCSNGNSLVAGES